MLIAKNESSGIEGVAAADAVATLDELAAAEIAAAWKEIAGAPTERPKTWDQLTDEEIAEILRKIDDDRR